MFGRAMVVLCGLSLASPALAATPKLKVHSMNRVEQWIVKAIIAKPVRNAVEQQLGGRAKLAASGWKLGAKMPIEVNSDVYNGVLPGGGAGTVESLPEQPSGGYGAGRPRLETPRVLHVQQGFGFGFEVRRLPLGQAIKARKLFDVKVDIPRMPTVGN